MRPRRRIWRGILAAAALAACVDGPTTPGRFGELRIRPTYAAGDEPDALGVAVDSAAVRVTRRSDPGVPLIDAFVAYGSDTASFAWILDLEADAESLRVDVALWGGGARLYDGTDTVEVRDALLDVAAAPLDVGYVGPAIVATVTVTPGLDTLDALGAATTLAAVARDRHDAIVPGATFSWTSGAGAVASVDPSGVVTAAGNGTTTITATTGSVSGGATVVVRQRVTQLAVTPGAITLTALGATQTLGAQPRDANGFAVADAAVTWSSDAPGVAAVDAATGLVTAVAGGSATITATSGGVTATSAVTVNPIADVAAIVVTPSATTLTALGATQQYRAEARDAGGMVLTGVQFTWASSLISVATVDAAGLAHAAGHGTTQITASAGAITGTATLTVNLSTTIASVTVAPPAATLTAIGATLAFSATARDASGAVVPVAAFAWSSAVPGVASVDPASGMATAASHGATAITATVAGVSGSAQLTVDLTPSVASVTVSPATATLGAVGATQQFTAVARDGQGAVVPGVPFSWTSDSPAVATADPLSGLATATGHGTTTINAATGSVSGGATLTVNLTPNVATITVSPPSARLTAIGATQQFTAEARDGSGAVLPGVPFVWTSGTPAVATIDAVTGLASAAAHGTTTITATAGGVSGTATLSVNLAAVIASVTVTPPTATLFTVGGTQAFTATARDAGGAVVPVAAFVWSSSVPAVATIDAVTGVATAVSHGVAPIAATVAGVSGTAALTVDLTPTVATVAVSPGVATLTAVGATQQFSAIARDGAGAEVPGVPFVWTSATGAVATIDAANGLATAAGHGTTAISASAGSVSGSATLTVNLAPSIATVTVSPATATLSAIGATQQFVAEARDGSGALLPGVPFVWTSGTPAVAAIDAVSGLASAAGHGAATITATAGGVSGTAALAVDLTPTVVSVTVSPPSATLLTVGATQHFAAVARDSQGDVVPGVPFVWSSGTPGVATVDASSGLATALAHGATTITAAAGGVSGSASLAVDLTPTVVSVTVSPVTATLLAAGATQQFTAVARDSQGSVVPGVPFVWSSGTPGVATVDASSGLATALAHGTTTIGAATGGVSGSASLTVDLAPAVATVTVSPVTATLLTLGATQQFSAVARDAQGDPLPGVPFVWASAVPAVAVVDPATGRATATGHGITLITATSGAVVGSADLTVNFAATIASVTVTPQTVTLEAVGATQQFTATARDAAGNVVPVAQFTWTTGEPAVATVDAVTGVATAVYNGTTHIAASVEGVTGTAQLTVEQRAVSILVRPPSWTLDKDQQRQFSAEALDANGNVVLGVTFTWSSSNTGVATVDANGLATACGFGTTEIRATAGTLTGHGLLTVERQGPKEKDP